MPTVDLVFDGQCGFCTRSVGWVKRLDRKERVVLHPFQRAGVQERFSLSDKEVQDASWAFSNGSKKSGAGAINLAFDGALGVTLFSRLYRVPGVRWAQDRVYGWIATHRYLLRGATPWCTKFPEDCENSIEGAACSIGVQGQHSACSR